MKNFKVLLIFLILSAAISLPAAQKPNEPSKKYKHEPVPQHIEEPSRLRSLILSQLTQSESNYIEYKSSDIAALSGIRGTTYHYGTVKFLPDNLSNIELELLQLLMINGRFMENGILHDIKGVTWVFESGLDRPYFFKQLLSKPEIVNEFRRNGRIVILSSYPNYRDKKIYTYQRYNFLVVPEYEERQIELLSERVGEEVDRITESRVGSTLGAEPKKVLLLSAPMTCAKLFK